MNNSIDNLLRYWNPEIGKHYLKNSRQKDAEDAENLDAIIAMSMTGGRMPSKEQYAEIRKSLKAYHQDNGSYHQQIYTSNHENYFFIPSNLAVRRVPGYSMGEGVLGRTWPGTGMIEILEHLYGQDFEEVLLHEILHNKYPQDSEGMIRRKTRERLPFQARWN